jgi:hypothetical protein
MRFSAAVAGLALLPSLALAQEAPITAADPESVRAAIVAYGHKGRMDTSDQGNPMILARAGDINYAVYFYGCENGVNCLDLQFSAWWEMEQPLTAEFANDFNSNWVMGKVWIDDAGNPTLNMSVVGTGGITEANFVDTLKVWEGVIDTFLQELP